MQRKFTLNFMRKFGMSKFKQNENSAMESKIINCLNVLLEGITITKEIRIETE